MAPRAASHAGSWYSNSGGRLSKELEGWLGQAKVEPMPTARAVIAPHAGYSFSGPTAAWAYGCVDPSTIKRVFVLGPSHHVYLDGCALTRCETYKTPIGDLVIDRDVTNELSQKGDFQWMSQETDEDEHSIEMHLPYIAKVFAGRNFTVVPILVGSISTTREKEYGELLAPYLADPSNFFVISSDFCHWGSRFQYTFYDKSCGEIWQSIEKLDHAGMSLIESLDTQGFAKYLKDYKNTICGRHPIGVLLNSIDTLGGARKGYNIQFKAYAQSSQVVAKNDSSVSYASAVVTLT